MTLRAISPMPSLLLMLALNSACGPNAPGPSPDFTALDGTNAADGPLDDGSSRDTQRPVDSGTERPHSGDAELELGTRPECESAGDSAMSDFRILDPKGEASAQVSGPICQRRFVLSTTASLRDGQPTNPRTIVERPNWPAVSTQNPLFDALYALTLEEAAEDSVDAIHDGAFDNGAPYRCPEGGCFETGQKWTYVWTRDTAYALALGLGQLDPQRAKNSLLFKTSPLRSGGGLQIVQDTGTGGSYPISSDRVAWALGAAEVLNLLEGAERTSFAAHTFEALKNTVERDRILVFDPASGLYRGEQSFLDWREQSYAPWVANDPVHIGMSRSLSTNLTHLAALELSSRLAAEHGEPTLETRYRAWASDLRKAIRSGLRFEDGLQLAAFIPTELDPGANGQREALGLALAVIAGVLSPVEAAQAIARYPLLPHGPPVLFPQQPGVPIYHNRAIWPFVTAFWLRAAKAVRNDRAVDLGVLSLMRGTALNLSNMENLELVEGLAYRADGALSGPVVNSRRQLWSVAGYLSMVHQLFFGLQTSPDGLSVSPYLTRRLRRLLFGSSDRLVLNRFPYRGRSLKIVVHLPALGAPGADTGAYQLANLRLDGTSIGRRTINASELGGTSVIEVELADEPEASASITLLTASPTPEALFAPQTPSLTSLSVVNGQLAVALDTAGEPDDRIRIHIYRDGQRIAADLPGATRSWQDPTVLSSGRSACYAVETRFVSSGNRSQRSAPLCFWGSNYERIVSISAHDFKNLGGDPIDNHGRFHYQNWGDPGHSLSVEELAPPYDGRYLLQVVAGNGAGPVSTGITCAIKRIQVFEATQGKRIGGGYLTMPQLGSWDRWADSSFVAVELEQAQRYRIIIDEDDLAYNMSSLSHFERYTGGLGGKLGAFNRVNIAELKLLYLGPR